MTEYIEKKFLEITSRTAIKEDAFPRGVKDFKFSIGQGQGFVPSESYFRVDLKLEVAGAAPANGDNIAFADSPCGNLFNNAYFNIGGQTVSSITNGMPQCEVLRNRLNNSSAYNKTIGQSQGFQPHFEERQKELAGTDTIYNKYNKGRHERMFIWQPALGIFSVSQPLGAGEYDIQLNPSQDYAKACVQAGTDKTYGVGAGEVKLTVMDIRFYACVVRTNLPSSGIDKLHLMEMHVSNCNMGANNTAVNEDISVPSSTRAISLFLQDVNAGRNNIVPSSLFHTEGTLDALALKDYQIEYANSVKPVTRHDSAYVTGKNTLQQRYINTAIESGMYFNPAGMSETFAEWCERGPLMHETFIKASDNLATRAHITANYGANSVASRLFVVAHHSKAVHITRQNGLVTDVTVASV